MYSFTKEKLHHNQLQWNSFFSIFIFIRQGLLKLSKLSPVFHICKVYLQYVFLYQREVTPQPIAMEQFFFQYSFSYDKGL